MKTYRQTLLITMMMTIVFAISVPTPAWAQAENTQFLGNATLHRGNWVSKVGSKDHVIVPSTTDVCGGVTRCSENNAPWRSPALIALTVAGQWLEVDCSIPASAVGIQFQGDDNDGWVSVYVNGQLHWYGNTYGNAQGGDPFVYYLEISGLPRQAHVVRIEATGQRGNDPGDMHVAVAAVVCSDSPIDMTMAAAPTSSTDFVLYLPAVTHNELDNQ